MFRKSILIFLSFLCLAACETLTHSEKQELDKKISAEPRADTPEDIVERASDTFANAKGLTEEQKKSLRSLYLKTYAESMAIRKEIGQMKSLLFKEVALKNFNSKEVSVLLSRIVNADERRLQVMFKALQTTQSIVGYGQDKKELYEYLREYDIPGSAQK